MNLDKIENDLKLMAAIEKAKEGTGTMDHLMLIKLEMIPRQMLDELSIKFMTDESFGSDTKEEQLMRLTSWWRYLKQLKAEIESDIFEAEMQIKKLDKVVNKF